MIYCYRSIITMVLSCIVSHVYTVSRKKASRAGADANTADTAGVTPLMLACQAYVPGANVAVIRYLVEKGSADPVRQDSEGRDSYDYCPPIDSQYVRAVLRSASGTVSHT